MLVNKIGIKSFYKVPFQRKLTKEEEKDYRQNALQPAFDYLGTKDIAMIIHGTSYPESSKDIGVGSPYGMAAEKLINFEKIHGFTSNQLGPVGVITDAQNISPYKSTVSSKNFLFLDFNKLTTEKYANILSKDDINSMLKTTQNTKENYSYSDFPEAFANYKYLINLANKNFETKLAERDESAIRLNSEFKEYKLKKGNTIKQEALFDILSKTYGSKDFSTWNDLDRDLIENIKNKNPEAIERYKKIITRSKDDYKSYIFAQFLLEKQVEENTKYRKDADFAYISDLLVGFSKSDEWANQDLFLKDYRMGCPHGGENGPQLWDIPVINPNKLFKEDGSLETAGLYLKKKIDSALDNFDNVRIDHALGLIDPFIYDKNSISTGYFKANNISQLPEIDPNGNYRKILNKIVIPTLEEHGISKNSPVWEDLCTDTSVFNNIYHDINNLPGITQLEWMRAENSQDPDDWGLVGSHDSEPAQKMIKRDWTRFHDAWNIFYLAGFLNSNPKRAEYRDSYCKKIDMDDKERVKAKFAELFLTCQKIQISFADFFGIDKTYNKGGEENNTNWRLRLDKDYEDEYYKNLASDNPTAINLPEVLQLAVQAKADMNAVKNASSTGEISSKNDAKTQQILDNLKHYENILKE